MLSSRFQEWLIFTLLLTPFFWLMWGAYGPKSLQTRKQQWVGALVVGGLVALYCVGILVRDGTIS